MANNLQPYRITRKEREKLSKKLKRSIIGILIFIVSIFIIAQFFGPQVGALFGLISRNRNDDGPTAELTLTTPTISNLPRATNKEQLIIEGASKPGSTVKLFLNGPEKAETLTGADGKFVFDNVNLIRGSNTLFVKAYGDNEEKSDKSETYVIHLDNEKPNILIEEPKDGKTITNLNNRILIKGSVNEKSRVRVNDKLAVLKPDNTFEFLLGVSEGGVTITVSAEDEAGNKDESIIKVTYSKDSQ